MESPSPSPPPSLQVHGDVRQQKEHFDLIAPQYIQGRNSENHQTIKKMIWEHFFGGTKCLFPTRRLNVLEAMCGLGEGKALLESFISQDFTYTGFDNSAPMIARAKELYPTDNIFLQDITSYKSIENFDVIILLSGLHHVHLHTGEILKTLYDALVPGGIFISFEPTNNNPVTALIGDFIYSRHRYFDHDSEKRYRLHAFNTALTQTGFTILKQSYPGLLAYALYYNPDIFPRLNIGNAAIVKGMARMERPFWDNAVGRYLSFATISLCQKPETT